MVSESHGTSALSISEQDAGTRVPDAGTGAPERALMRAVLADATRCLVGQAGPAGQRARLAAEARDWIASRDRSWPFAFENLCEALELPTDRIRTRLLRDYEPVVDEERRRPGRPRHSTRSADVTRLIREGLPLRVIARRLGMSISQASTISGRLVTRMREERDEEIRTLRQAGWKPQAIAARFNLSRLRVARICNRRAPSMPRPLLKVYDHDPEDGVPPPTTLAAGEERRVG